MAAINFPDSPSEGDSFQVGVRFYRYRNGQWMVANTITAHTKAFEMANTVNGIATTTKVQQTSPYLPDYDYLANTMNVWVAENTILTGNLRILGNSALGAQDTFKIDGVGLTSGAVINLRQVGAHNNTLMRMFTNGKIHVAQAPNGIAANGHREVVAGRWFVEKLEQDFATSSVGNNRTGFKLTGIPGKTFAFKAYITVSANVGGPGTTGVNYGMLYSPNVRQMGSLTWIPTGATTMNYMAPTANSGQISRGANASLPNEATPTLIQTWGMVEFPANSANDVGGPNVEITLGTETAGNGVQILSNSFITYMVLP